MEAIDGFTRRLRLLQTEAQDLIELQARKFLPCITKVANFANDNAGAS